MRKLTQAQAEYVAWCLTNDAAWCTARYSPNHLLLGAWEENGWTVEVEPPSGVVSLVAYKFTPEGRKALEAPDA